MALDPRGTDGAGAATRAAARIRELERAVEALQRRDAAAFGYLQLRAAPAAGVPDGSLFVDIADGAAKFKDAAGALHALY